MFRFPSLALIRSLTAQANQLRFSDDPVSKALADKLMAATNPQREYRTTKRGAHTRNFGRPAKKTNRQNVSARTKRKHRRAA